MSRRARGDVYFDLRVLGCKGAEKLSEECVHAFGTASPVAVVEVQPLALEDECAHAISTG